MTGFFTNAGQQVETLVKPRYEALINSLKEYPPYFAQAEKYAEGLKILQLVVALMETQQGKDLFLWMVLTGSHIDFGACGERFRMTPTGMSKYVAGNYHGWMPQPLFEVLRSREGCEARISERLQQAFKKKRAA